MNNIVNEILSIIFKIENDKNFLLKDTLRELTRVAAEHLYIKDADVGKIELLAAGVDKNTLKKYAILRINEEKEIRLWEKLETI